MSWVQSIFPYGGSTSPTNQTISTVNPALSLSGTEAGGGLVTVLEYQGGMFLLTNVVYAPVSNQFSLINPAKAGTGLFVGANNSLTMYQQSAASAAWVGFAWSSVLWGFSATGSLIIGDINTSTTPLTVETPSVAVTVPNTANAGLTVQNSTTTFSPRVYAAQNVAGGAKWGFDSLNGNMRFLSTPFGSGTETTSATILAAGGPANNSVFNVSNNPVLTAFTPAGGSLANTLHMVYGTATFTGTIAAGSLITSTIVFTNAAVFTTASSFSTTVSQVTSGTTAFVPEFVVLQTATGLTIQQINTTASVQTSVGTVNFICIGY